MKKERSKYLDMAQQKRQQQQQGVKLQMFPGFGLQYAFLMIKNN